MSSSFANACASRPYRTFTPVLQLSPIPSEQGAAPQTQIIAAEAVSRKTNKRSRHRRKAVLALVKKHAHIANRRKDFLHQESNKLINCCGVIATAQLNVKRMTARGAPIQPA